MDWLIGVGLWGLLVLFAWALCLNARQADEQAERLHEELQRKERADD